MASILKIVITRNTICDNLVGFPKLGHICICFQFLSLWPLDFVLGKSLASIRTTCHMFV